MHRLSPDLDVPVDAIGAKAHGLVTLMRLGLPVPPAFVIDVERSVGTAAGAAAGRGAEVAGVVAGGIAAALAELDAPSVSVRSGAAVSMPGMMDTVLDVAPERVASAIAAVRASWDTPRARTYRELYDIPHDLGTAVVVQAMVFGDRDERSGAGVAFSRDPGTGAPGPSGEFLFGRRGDAVVSGTAPSRPLTGLRDREPAVWAQLRDALDRVERHHRDACYLEFTVESGRLWLLQARPGRFVGAAAVRSAVDLVEEGLLDRGAALCRITARDLERARVPRLVAVDVLARGLGACPGVAAGRIATTAEMAVRMAADGPVVLVRPETSPADLRGMAAATGIVTARGGPAGHAAVVARALGRPAVVGVADLVVGDRAIDVGGRTVPVGAAIAVDGTSGHVVLGPPHLAPVPGTPAALRRLLTWADDVSGDTSDRPDADRLAAAHAVLSAARTVHW